MLTVDAAAANFGAPALLQILDVPHVPAVSEIVVPYGHPSDDDVQDSEVLDADPGPSEGDGDEDDPEEDEDDGPEVVIAQG